MSVGWCTSQNANVILTFIKSECVSTNSLQSWTKVNVYWDRILFIYQSWTIPYLLLWENLLQKNKFSCMFLHLYQSDLALYLSCLTPPSLHDWGGKKRRYTWKQNKKSMKAALHEEAISSKERGYVCNPGQSWGEILNGAVPKQTIICCLDGEVKQMRYQVSW